jgi:hypothetical protein
VYAFQTEEPGNMNLKIKLQWIHIIGKAWEIMLR